MGVQSQLYGRWEEARGAQPSRQLMLGLTLGQDSLDLLSFSASGRVQHTGLLPVQWSADCSGWQLGGPSGPGGLNAFPVTAS